MLASRCTRGARAISGKFRANRKSQGRGPPYEVFAEVVLEWRGVFNDFFDWEKEG